MQGIIQTNHDLRNASLDEIKEFLQELQYELRYRFSTLSKDNFSEQDLAEMHVGKAAIAGNATTATTAALAARIPAGQVDSTSTATKFTATVPGITELKTGVAVYLMNGVVTSASGCTLNVNGLGAKPIYQTLAAESRSTTIFNINYTMLFVYNEDRVEGGCWDVYYGYNSDTNTIAYNVRTNAAPGNMALALTRYKIIFTKRDGTLLPSTQTSNSTGTTKTINTDPFDPFQPIYYYATTTGVAVGAAPSASYMYMQHSAIDLRYSFNAGSTLTTGKAVYLRCVPDADCTVKLDGNNCVTQTLPNTNDGKVYIYLGKAYSTTQIWLSQNHPIYMYDTKLHLWNGE